MIIRRFWTFWRADERGMVMYRILFVEDDEDIRFLVSRYKIWRQGQYRIAGTASNGREALDQMASAHYDLVITDIRMPVMDGLELCRRIRELGYQTVTILASTYNDFAYAKEGMRQGAVEYIEKPYNEEKLAEALNLAGRFMRGNLLEEEIYDSLMSEAQTAQSLAARLVERLRAMFPEIPLMRRREAAAILQGIYVKLEQQAPWLEMIEPVDIYIGENIPDDVERVLQEYLGIIQQYKLREPDTVVQKITAILRHDVCRPHLLDYLSEQMDLSKDYMGKRFRNVAGITISEYCTRLKMEQAKIMLTGTTKKVYEISGELGYATVDYFTGLFKNYTGTTPTVYRNSEKK